MSCVSFNTGLKRDCFSVLTVPAVALLCKEYLQPFTVVKHCLTNLWGQWWKRGCTETCLSLLEGSEPLLEPRGQNKVTAACQQCQLLPQVRILTQRQLPHPHPRSRQDRVHMHKCKYRWAVILVRTDHKWDWKQEAVAVLVSLWLSSGRARGS